MSIPCSVAELRERANGGLGICVIAPTRFLVEKVYAPALSEAGIDTRIIDRNDEMFEEPGVRVCTMHRAKGLEFEHVVLAGLGDARFPRPIDDGLAGDDVATRAHDDQQRALIFVSPTRARDTLCVTGWGARARLVEHEVRGDAGVCT